MKTFIIAFGVSFSILVHAQIPGYQGQRLTLGFNASTFLFFEYLSEFPSGARISYKSELELNFATSRKVAMGSSVFFGRQNYYHYKSEFAFTDNALGRPMVIKDQYIPVKILMADLHIRFYARNFIAPVGIYHQFSAGIIQYFLADQSGEVVTINYSGLDNVSSTVSSPSEPFKGYKLGYQLGRSMPIGHKFYLNTSFGVNFFRGGNTTIIKTNLSENNVLLAMMNSNLRQHNFAEIRIGFGYFAF